MMKIWFILFFGMSVAFNAQAQQVDPKKLDESRLNEYILKEVNALRKRKRLDTLVVDAVLNQAATDHAHYMGDNDVLTHDQKKSRSKQTPYDRVVFFGGAHSQVGENVQVYDLDYALKKSKNRLTYEKLAKDMVKVWVKSKPHYTNLVNDDYARVAHAFYLKDGKLYACQVFGSKPFEEQYDYEKGEPIAVRAKKECANCRQTQKKINKDEVSLGWYTVSNDSVYYWNTNYYYKQRFYRPDKNKALLNLRKNNLRKVFKSGGKIAVDLIHYNQFDCTGHPSFHNALYHNGYFLGTVDKNTVKYNDLDPSDDFVKVYVGMKPAFRDTFYQVDFQLVKKKRPCMQTSTIYVTPDYLRPHEYFVMPSPTVTLDKNLIVEDSVLMRINFKRNQTNQDTTIFQSLVKTMDSLVRDNHQIETIYFTGVASIEGTEKANRKLFIKRGAIIEGYLKRYYPNIPFKSEFYENFDDFRAGLVSVGYRDVTEVSDDTLRIFANENRNDPEIAAVLDQTRFSSIRVLYRDYFPIEEGSYGLSVERIRDLMKEERIKEIVPLYLVMANKVIAGESDASTELMALEFPKEPAYASLHWYQFLLRLQLMKEPVLPEELNELKAIGAIKSDANFLAYALLFNLFNRNEAITVENADLILEGIKAKKQKAWIETLQLINEVENYRLAADDATPIILDNVLRRKFDVTQTYMVCQYLIQWGYTAEPYVLLSKFARRPNQLPKLYAQYLKLGYFLGQFDSKREWKAIQRVIKNLAENNTEAFCNLFKWNQMGVRSLEKEAISKLFCEKCKDEAAQMNQVP